MASRTGKGKNKKPLETTLGKALNNEKPVDLSHIQTPIHTNIFGLKQVLSLFETATEEVKNYITYECDIMYECRICRTIFRSLANFILHKRSYCRERFNIINNLNLDKCPASIDVKISSDISGSEQHNELKSTKKNISPIIEKLIQKQQINQLAKDALNEDLSVNKTSTDNVPVQDSSKTSEGVFLEKIETSNSAVFQTMLDDTKEDKITEFMKSEVMEIHGILESDEAVIGPDGKICTFSTNKKNEKPIIPKSNLYCTECDLKFSTKKTLTYHIKYKHNNTRVVFVCPVCKDTLANAWCVYRHLLKVHRKTSTQIKKMRDVIHNSVIRKDQDPANKKEEKHIQEKTDDENQWLSNVEGDNDLQMCGGCGKRFERKAALNSHSQMCVKRIAVCNSIKESNAAKKKEEDKDLKDKNSKSEKLLECTANLKGSAKRKPYLLRTYKPNGTPSNTDNLTCDLNANNEILPKTTPTRTKSFDSNCSSDSHNLVPDTETSDSFDKENLEDIISVSEITDRNYKHIEIVEEDFENEKVEKRLPIILRRKNSPRKPNNNDKQSKSEDSNDQQNNSIDPLQLNVTSMETDSIVIIDEKPKPTIQVRNIKELISNEIPLDICSSSPEDSVNEIIETNESIEQRKISSELIKELNLQNTDPNLLLDENDINFITKVRPYMNYKELTCVSCVRTFSELSQLLWHMSAHFSWFRFQCSRCSFISFSKHDCASHAQDEHYIPRSVVDSVVLPIPKWKTVLMSHDFKLLQDDSYFKGKHTDEIIIINPEDNLPNSNLLNEETDCDDVKIDPNALFVDFNYSDTKVDDSSTSTNLRCSEIQKCEKIIDLVEDDDTDKCQLEFPRDTFLLEESEIINGIIDAEYLQDNKSFIKERLPVNPNSDCDELSDEYFDIEQKEIKSEIISEETESEQKFFVNDIEDTSVDTNIPVTIFAPPEEKSGQLRPIRNRTRSIKTLQADFLYDLSSRVKLNDNNRHKNVGLLKHKKNLNLGMKTKAMLRPLRVYSQGKNLASKEITPPD